MCLCARRVFYVSHPLIQYRVQHKNYDSARPLFFCVNRGDVASVLPLGPELKPAIALTKLQLR
jgi:hypothetical protein